MARVIALEETISIYSWYHTILRFYRNNLGTIVKNKNKPNFPMFQIHQSRPTVCNLILTDNCKILETHRIDQEIGIFMLQKGSIQTKK